MDLKFFEKNDLKKKITIGLVIFPLMIGLIIFYVVYPTIKDIKKMGEQIMAQRTDLEQKYKKGQSLKQLSKNLEIIEPQLNKLDQIFIEKGTVLEFITTLEKIAGDNGVTQKINLISSKNIAGEYYEKTPIQIFANGNFKEQLSYLTGLEALNYYINIKVLEISSAAARSSNSKDQTGEDNINTLIFADTYWKK